MKQKVMSTMMSVLVAAAIVATPSVAHAGQSQAIGEAEFVEGSMEILGWSEEEASAAWADEELREIIPVYSEVEESEVVRPATKSEVANAQRNSDTFVAAAATQQKSWTVKKKYFSFNGTEVFNLSMTKSFTYNGARVWHGAATTTPWSNPLTGWSYQGNGVSTDQYGPIGGVANSATISERAGLWNTIGHIGTSASVGIRMEGRYNGVTTSSTWSA